MLSPILILIRRILYLSPHSFAKIEYVVMMIWIDFYLWILEVLNDMFRDKVIYEHHLENVRPFFQFVDQTSWCNNKMNPWMI